MTTAEFSRIVKLNTLGTAKQAADYSASREECAALANRFGLLGVVSISAYVMTNRSDDAVSVVGQFHAHVTQACVVTGAPVSFKTTERLDVRFVPAARYDPDAEIELDAEDCDTFEHDGQSVDIGEAIAQSLLLALDPFPRAKGADSLLKAAGVQSEDEVTTGAFASLASLRDKLSS